MTEVTNKTMDAIEAQGSRRGGVCIAWAFNCNTNAESLHAVDESALGRVGCVFGVVVKNVGLSEQQLLTGFKESYWPPTFGGVEAPVDDADEAIQARSRHKAAGDVHAVLAHSLAALVHRKGRGGAWRMRSDCS